MLQRYKHFKMKTVLYPANTRGTADFGWLKANYSFSFANYYDPTRIHFGALRVLNDDYIAPGMGFGKHPHDNMEIVTIPLEGAVAHEDSTGMSGIVGVGDVQIMSAGTGVFHSEKNASATEPLKLFQIWVMPKLKNISPRYDQRKFDVKEYENRWKTLVSPLGSDMDSLQVNADTYFNMTKTAAGESLSYQFHQKNQGAYIMVVDGEIEVGGKTLGKRDAIGISEVDSLEIHFLKESQVLLIEIPMVW